MIYSISLISTTGYPFYQGTFAQEPADIDLKLYFYEYGRNQSWEEFSTIDEVTTFELNAGLISALYEFARLLKRPITGLLFKYTGNLPNSQPDIDFEPVPPPEDIGTIASVRCDVYNHSSEVKKKVDLIWNNYVRKYAPFGPDKTFGREDAGIIMDILSDSEAKNKLNSCFDAINDASEKFLEEMHSYGVESIIITTFDLTPLKTFGDLSLSEAEECLRNIGEVPEVDTYQWIYRPTSYNRDEKPRHLWNFIINSGAGVTVEGLFQPYHYMLLCEPGSFLGEVPQRYYNLVNKFLLD